SPGTLARMRRAREIWVQIIRQFEKSGLTQDAFAAERGIPVGTLRGWIYKLRCDEEDTTPVLPVRVVGSTAPLARPSGGELPAIEVAVGELVVRFPLGTPASTIVEVVTLLRDRC